MKIRIFDVKTRFALLLALVLGLTAAGPAFAAGCNVTLSAILPSNHAVLKADCGLNNMESITWKSTDVTNPPVPPAVPTTTTLGTYTFPATTADIFYSTLLTNGTFSFTAEGVDSSGATVAGGKAAVVTLAKPILNVAVTPGGLVTSAPQGIEDCTTAANGTPSGVCSAGFDSNTTVVLMANEISGNSFLAWGGDCSGAGKTCAVSMTAPRTVTAMFRNIPSFAVTGVASPSAGGSVSCPSPVTSGGTTTCAINTTQGYTLTGASSNTCGGSLSGATGFNTGAVTSACTVTATFSLTPQSFTVTGAASPSAGGSVSCPSPVTSGGTTTCTISTTQGYTLTGASSNACGGSLSPFGNAYTTGPVTSVCTVTATFSLTPQSFTVTGVASPPAGGSVSCSSPVTSGSTTTCTISTTQGYTLTGASSNACGGSRSGSTYTTGSVTSACTVTATFTTSTGTASCGAGETMAAGDRTWTTFVPIQVWPVPPIVGSGASGRAIQFVADSNQYPRGVQWQAIDQSNGPEKDYVVSACPHSFTPVNGNPLCKVTGAGRTAGPIYLRFGPSVPRTWFGQPQPDIDCPLTPGGTYFINFRDSTTAYGTVSSQFLFYDRNGMD